MSDSAPRDTAQADAKQTDATQAKAAEAEAETPDEQTAAPDAEGKPDIDEVKRKFRAALDKKREIQAEGSGAGGRNTGKIHGAHGSEDHRRTFRRKSG